MMKKNRMLSRVVMSLGLTIGVSVVLCMIAAALVRSGVISQHWMTGASAVCAGLGVLLAGVISARQEMGKRALAISLNALCMFALCLLVGLSVFDGSPRQVGLMGGAMAGGAALAILTTNSKRKGGAKRAIRKRSCKKK